MPAGSRPVERRLWLVASRKVGVRWCSLSLHRCLPAYGRPFLKFYRSGELWKGSRVGRRFMKVVNAAAISAAVEWGLDCDRHLRVSHSIIQESCAVQGLRPQFQRRRTARLKPCPDTSLRITKPAYCIVCLQSPRYYSLRITKAWVVRSRVTKPAKVVPSQQRTARRSTNNRPS